MRHVLASLSGWNRALLVLLGVQLVFVVADRVIVEPAFAPERPLTGTRVFPLLDPAAVSGVLLTGGARTTELERRGDDWFVRNENGTKADPYFVRILLDALVKLAPGPVVSENAARHQAYEVAGNLALEVTVLGAGGAEIGRFVCGKATTDGRAFYLRYPADSDLVMLVRPNQRDAFVRGANARGAWREKTIFEDERRRIRAFEIVAAEESIVIEREVADGALPSDQDVWRMTRPLQGRVLPLVASGMLTGMADLKADAYHERGEDGARLGLDPPRVRVIARLDDGSERSLEIGDESGNLLYVRAGERAEVYRVQTFRLFNFLRPARDLLEQ